MKGAAGAVIGNEDTKAEEVRDGQGLKDDGPLGA